MICTTGWVPADEIITHIDDQFARGPYLLSDAFSTADILFGSTFALFKGSPLMPDSAVRNAYIERLTSRPVFNRRRQEHRARRLVVTPCQADPRQRQCAARAGARPIRTASR